MARGALPIDEEEYEPIDLPSNPLFDGPPEEPVSWTDYGRAAASGAYGVAGAAGAAAQYVTGAEEGSLAARLRRFGETGAEEQISRMSPAARRAISAGVLPGEGEDIFDPNVSTRSAIGLKVTSSLPSLAASLLPGGLAARLALRAGAAAAGAGAVGTAAGGAAAGVLTGGDVFERIQSGVLSMSDEELREESPGYDGLRDMGFSEEEAKRRVVEKTAGFKPLYMAGLTALTSKYGVEGLLASRVAGAGTRGVLRGAGVGALGEAAQETTEETAASVLSQTGQQQIRGDNIEIDWLAALSAGAEGGLIGGVLGGGVGAATGAGRRRATSEPATTPADIDPDVAATQGQPAEPGQVPSEGTPAAPASGELTSPLPVIRVRPRGRRRRREEEPVIETDTSATPAEQGAATGTPGANAPTSIEEGLTEAGRALDRVPGMIEEAERGTGNRAQPAVPGRTAPVPGIIEQAESLAPTPPPPASSVDPDAAAALDAINQRAGPVEAEPVPYIDPELGEDPDAIPPVPDVPVVTPEVSRVITAPPQEPIQPPSGVGAPPPAPLPPTPEEAAAPRRGPRVLTDLTRQEAPVPIERPVAAKRERTSERVTKADIEEALTRGTRLPLSTNPDDFTTDADFRQVTKIARKARERAAELKVELSPDIETLANYKGVKVPTEGRDAYLAARTRLAEGTLSAPTAERGAARAEAKRNEAMERQGVAVEGIVKGMDYTDDVRQGKTDAIRTYIKNLLTAARAAKVTPPQRVTEGMSPWLGHLANARSLQASGNRKSLQQFMADDFALRHGETELIKETRQAQAQKTAPVVEEKQVEEAFAEREAEPLTEEETEREAEEAPAPVARERAPVAVGPGAFRAVTGPARAVTVEKRRGRTTQTKATLPSKVPNRNSTITRTAQTEADAADDLIGMRLDESEDILQADDMSAAERFLKFRKQATPGVHNLPGRVGQAHRKTTLDQMLSEINPRRLPEGQRKTVKFWSQQLRQFAGDVPVYIVSQDEMVKARGKKNVTGFWDRNGEYLVLNQMALDFDPELMAHVIVHEGSHAALQKVITARPPFQRRIDMIRLEMKEALDKAGIDTGGVGLGYGVLNAHEFIAETMGNPDFQAALASVQASPELIQALDLKGKPTLWEAFREMVRRIFMVDPADLTLLDAALTATEEAFILKRVDTGEITSNEDADDMMLAEMKGRAFDYGTSWSINSRRMRLKVSTLDQIRQRAKGLFLTEKGDAIERVVSAIQRQEGDTNKNRESGQKLTSRFVKLPKGEQPKAADLAVRLTMADGVVINDTNWTQAKLDAANAHLGKDRAATRRSRKQLPAFQKEFMALSPATREWFIDTAKFFRDTQNTMTKQAVGNILDTLENPPTGADRDALVNKTVAGTLTDEDHKKIDNEIVSNALRGAQGLRVIKGMYFPLMRHGNYVVTGTSAMPGNLHGGKISTQKKNTIEFEGATDKEARDKFNNFSDDPTMPLHITSVGKQRRLTATGEIVSEAKARGQPHTIIYNARLQPESVFFFDSASEAARFKRENASQFQRTSAVQERADFEARGEIGSRELSAIVSSVDKRTDISAGTKELMKTTLQQAAIRLMAGNRVQHRSLVRKNIYGASRDMARNMLDYSEASSRYLSKLRYMPQVREAFKDMEGLIKSEPDHPDQPARSQTLKELQNRINYNVTDIKEAGPFIKNVMLLSYLDKLFSPAYSIVNGMQPWMVTAPYLGGIYGNVRSGLQLVRAYNAVGGLGAVRAGLANTYRTMAGVTQPAIDTTDVVKSIRANLGKEKDGAALTRLLDMLVDRGAIDQAAGFEIAAAVSSGAGPWGTGLAKADRIARQLPIAVEAINRSTTAVAAYRLAKGSGMSDAQAQGFAFDTVQNTQGDYSVANAPSFFNNPILRPALQFKKYAQMMSHLLYDMTRKAAFGEGKERRIALKQLTNIIGVQVAMAGAMGLPGLELLKVGTMIAAALGLTDDDWEKQKQDIRETMDQAFGKTWGELLSKGVVSRAAGIDLSSRLGLADMWTFGEPKTTDREGLQSYMFQLFGGAPGSLLNDWVEGTRAAADGELMKAATMMVPNKFVSDTLKAAKGRFDETTNTPLTKSEAVLQMVGFRSGRMAEESDRVGKSIGQRNEWAEDAKELSKEYLNATTSAQRLKIRARIKKHNETKGIGLKQKVFPTALDKVRKEREERRREVQGE